MSYAPHNETWIGQPPYRPKETKLNDDKEHELRQIWCDVPRRIVSFECDDCGGQFPKSIIVEFSRGVLVKFSRCKILS